MNIKAMIKLMRPKQWIKNGFVFAALVFSGNFLDINLLKTNIITFVLFCLTSSTVYVLNDIVDLEKDKMHPQKRSRPLPSGQITKSSAMLLDVVLLAIVTTSSWMLLDAKILLIYIIYLVTNLLYSFKLKNVVIIDVMIITFGFVLRVESGSIATNVELSPWLILCTLLLSLFLALNKRKSELIMLKDKSGSHRKILEEYSIGMIDRMLNTVTPTIIVSYCLYTFSSIQSRTMMYTIPFVLYGVFRYEYLMSKENIGSKPEDVFTKDVPFLVNIILWGLSVLLIIYYKL